VEQLIVNNGLVNGTEKIEAERKRDADLNVVRIRVHLYILYIQFVVILYIGRLINFLLTESTKYYYRLK